MPAKRKPDLKALESLGKTPLSGKDIEAFVDYARERLRASNLRDVSSLLNINHSGLWAFANSRPVTEGGEPRGMHLKNLVTLAAYFEAEDEAGKPMNPAQLMQDALNS